VKVPLGACFAITAIISAAGSALAVELPHRTGAQSRLPSKEASALGDQRITVGATPPKMRDNHVLEFLQWKAQLGAASGRRP
jgi:hypothetical protein